ncbi:hypothetical protein [Actinomadura flavalba]|uniref:hypothetical protein n=1 Tax=Actinomadura flavalba TaxID=1120938 RepID=UPI0012DE4533|nr:hypothetical protein [Actinomadura flavalba]
MAERAGNADDGPVEEKPVPRDVPVDEFSELPEGLREEVGEEESDAVKDDPETEPAEEAGPAS